MVGGRECTLQVAKPFWFEPHRKPARRPRCSSFVAMSIASYAGLGSANAADATAARREGRRLREEDLKFEQTDTFYGTIVKKLEVPLTGLSPSVEPWTMKHFCPFAWLWLLLSLTT